jgi:hypothetical protein
MNLDIALLLAQDGLVNGAIYALLALALVLVFSVTSPSHASSSSPRASSSPSAG